MREFLKASAIGAAIIGATVAFCYGVMTMTIWIMFAALSAPAQAEPTRLELVRRSAAPLRPRQPVPALSSWSSTDHPALLRGSLDPLGIISLFADAEHGHELTRTVIRDRIMRRLSTD